MSQHTFQNGVEGKNCSRCGTWMPLADYGILRRSKDGLSPNCHKCRRETAKRERQRHPARSTKFYHLHHEEELAKRKRQRQLITEQDAVADEKFRQRFFSRVKKGEPDECWEWTSYCFPTGYGQIGYKGGTFESHRIAFLFAGGEIPEGLLICHTCDNHPCCNPRHLFVGSHLDNMRDKVAKDRQWRPVGEKHGCAKLTWEQIKEIRQMYKEGYQQKEIAPKYGIGQQNVSDIVLNNTWFDPDYVPIKRRGIK